MKNHKIFFKKNLRIIFRNKKWKQKFLQNNLKKQLNRNHKNKNVLLKKVNFLKTKIFTKKKTIKKKKKLIIPTPKLNKFSVKGK